MPPPVMLPCLVHRHFGGDYAVVSPVPATPAASVSPPYPIVLGSVIPAPTYAHLVDRLYTEAFADAHQQSITFAVVGHVEGLPRYEAVDSLGVTFSEHLVRSGYAVPDHAALVDHPRANQLIAALRDARSTHAGIWSEWTAEAYRDTLPFPMVAATNPPAVTSAISAGMGVLSVITVIVLLGILALRDSGYERRGGSRLKRLGGMMIGSYGPGGYHGVSADTIKEKVHGALQPSAPAEQKP